MSINVTRHLRLTNYTKKPSLNAQKVPPTWNNNEYVQKNDFGCYNFPFSSLE